MLQTMQSYLPAEWQRTVEFLGTPLWWIPGWQATVLDFTLTGESPIEVAVKSLFLLGPALVVLLGLWVTTASLYTLPFRAQRSAFLITTTLQWWDAARMIWFFWAGVLRFAVFALGWVWGFLRLALQVVVRSVKGIVTSPMMLLDWTTREYFQPGVPWVAFLLTLGWSALEATIFTYTLLPTMTEVLADITGFEPHRAVVTVVLWMLLVLLIAGSFACLLVLGEAIRAKRVPGIIQMAVVELFVMFFEVVFLYRELIDAITPWVAQQTGGKVQMGLMSTLALAAFGWIGIRAMTWFLFARYGTGTLVAVLSRQTMLGRERAPVRPVPVPPAVWSEAIAALKEQSEWFKQEGRYAFELLSLPVLQLLATAVNFVVVAVRSEPLFPLPFKSLDDVIAAVPRIETPRTTVLRHAVESAKGGTR